MIMFRRPYLSVLNPNTMRYFSKKSVKENGSGIMTVVTQLIQNGVLKPDKNQVVVLKRLSHLQELLKNFVPIPEAPTKPSPPMSLNSYEFSDKDNSDEAILWRTNKEKERKDFETALSEYNRSLERILTLTPRGMYIWGDVGTGKSMLMDLFIETCPLHDTQDLALAMESTDHIKRGKQRVHFHQFMLDVHRRLHMIRQTRLKAKQLDEAPKNYELSPLHEVAATIARNTMILAFDEFQVTDVGDALILGQLFEELWKRGVVIIITSNRPPSDLFQPGFNKSYFERFMKLLAERCHIQHLATVEDYRQSLSEVSDGQVGCYFQPSDLKSFIVEEVDVKLKETDKEENIKIEHMNILFPLYHFLIGKFCSQDSGVLKDIYKDQDNLDCCDIRVSEQRTLHIKHGVPHTQNDQLWNGGVCLFTFNDICSSDIGAADYKAVCDHFHTVIISEVPIMKEKDHNKARRFITLIDELYEHHTRVIISAETSPQLLFSSLSQTEEVKPLAGTIHAHKHRIDNGENNGTKSQQLLDEVEDFAATKGSVAVAHSEQAAVKELRFAFKRAASRLVEMGGKHYLQNHQKQWPTARAIPDRDTVLRLLNQ